MESIKMLSYKEYKLLNESLYGAFNLGLKNPATIGGIISGSSINGTEAALEAEAEDAIEESKKMKKKMDCGDEEDEEEEVEDEKDSEEEKEGEEDSEDEEEEEDEEDEEDSEDEEEKEEPKFMKKKAKKEWSEVLADLEEVLSEVSDEVAMEDIRKGLGLIKEGVKKSKKKKGCGCGCTCDKCMNSKKELKGGQNKLDVDGDGKITGSDFAAMKKNKKKMKKGCGSKYMNEEDQAWWDSVNGMMNSDPNQKNWSGWSEIGEVQQAVRENTDINEI